MHLSTLNSNPFFRICNLQWKSGQKNKGDESLRRKGSFYFTLLPLNERQFVQMEIIKGAVLGLIFALSDVNFYPELMDISDCDNAFGVFVVMSATGRRQFCGHIYRYNVNSEHT